MKSLLKRLRVMTIPAVLLTASCSVAAWNAPPAWTIRADGRIRASQRQEDFSAAEFIAKVKSEEGKDFGYVLTPAGESAITRELYSRNAEITRLRNELQNCRYGK